MKCWAEYYGRVVGPQRVNCRREWEIKWKKEGREFVYGDVVVATMHRAVSRRLMWFEVGVFGLQIESCNFSRLKLFDY